MGFGHVELQECSVWENLRINTPDDGYSWHNVHIYHATECQLYRRNKKSIWECCKQFAVCIHYLSNIDADADIQCRW